MEKKVVLFIINLFMIFNIYTQQGEFCGQIEYTFVTDIAYKYTENYILTFSNRKSLCEEVNIKKKTNEKKKEYKEEGIQNNIIVGRKNLKSKYYYNLEDTLYVRDNYLDKIILYKEEPLKEKWLLSKETKKLLNFTCKKATIYFRGRNYTAWYTTTIPVTFGPWKLKGLPGLILELYDSDNVFHIIANKVRLGKNDCEIEVDNNEIKQALTLNSYLKEREILIDKLFSRMSSKRAKGSKPLARDKNCGDCSKKTVEIFNEQN